MKTLAQRCAQARRPTRKYIKRPHCTSVHWSIGGYVAKVPVFMPDRRRSFRRLRPILGKLPLCIGRRGNCAVYAHRDSLAAHFHLRRMREYCSTASNWRAAR